jgi:hypothetical protein
MLRRLWPIALGLAVLGLSCDSAVPSVEQGTEALISDAVHKGGTPGFYFLPPIAPATTLIGTFDAALSPTVHIDQMSPSGTPLSTLATFTMSSGPGSETIRLDLAEPNYVVDWHTKDFNLNPGAYRVNVLLEARLIGFVDVEVGSTSAGFQNGSTIPIKFWMNTCVPIICTASDQCHTAGVCDPLTTLCSNPAAADGTSCNDGNACTQTDTCVSGACTGANPIACSALDACHLAGPCDPGSGACSNPLAGDGTACDDGDPCTAGDGCVAGVCRSGATNTCGTCPSPNTGITGVYRGTAILAHYWTIATGSWYGPTNCTEQMSRDEAPAVLDISGPPYAVSLDQAGNLDLTTPPPWGGDAWEVSPSGLGLSHLLPCINYPRWELDNDANIVIDPATGAATFHAHCQTGFPDFCGFSPNEQWDWDMVLPLSCVTGETVLINGRAVTCDANGTITSSVPCTRAPGPCAPPRSDLCGSGATASCTTLASDRKNCGQCGNVCAPEEICSGGACIAGCSCEFTEEGACDLTSSPLSCGACSHFCTPMETCIAGQCVGECPSATPAACVTPSYGTLQSCADLSSDPQNCGSCGNTCPPEQPFCVSYSCWCSPEGGLGGCI